MILKALYDYYHRSDDLAPAGLEYKEIPFLIVIDEEGNFLRIEDCRIDKKRSHNYLVVKGMRCGTTPKPYLFWDNVEYTLNYTKDHEPLSEIDATNNKLIKEREDKIAKSNNKHQMLIEKWKQISSQLSDETDLKAVILFYEKNSLQALKESPLWDEIKKKPTVNISFLLQGKLRPVAENPQLHLFIKSETKSDIKSDGNGKETICLVTGERGIPVEISTSTSIPGAQATAKLVAFQVNSGYDSYGKSKGNNAPVSKEAEASYTTALNKLLNPNSKNKFFIGNRTFVFWASSNAEASKAVEEGLFALLNFNDANEDDPNHRIEQVKKVFMSIYSGSLNTELNDKFYFLGLAPNSARLAVVYWNESKLQEFAGKILQHFNDMEIANSRKEKKPYYGIHQMMSAVTLKGKSSDVQPNLPESVLRSILQGTPYSYALLLACIKRIRAEQQINIARAAIIKAYLNRINDNNQKLKIMVDKENTNQGYLCGRLFATLEYLQERSNGAKTIRSRYMNSASATPAAVFATLLNLSNHHEDKLNKNSQIFFEQIKSEIIDKISPAGFPTHLSLPDQGRFMVGYYQQMQHFYTKKEDSKEIEVEQ